MKVEWTPPTQSKILEFLGDDILRSPKAKEFWRHKSSEDFTQNLAMRINNARFDPRLTESCVERIALFPEKIHLPLLVEEFQKSPWPFAFCCIFDWARSLFPKNRSLHLIWRMLSKQASITDPKTLESFYFDLHNPTSKRSQEAIETNNAKQWERSHFWSGAAPYSKELLKMFGYNKLGDFTGSRQVSARCVENRLRQFFLKNKNVYYPISKIELELELVLSRRQLLRHLANLKGLRLIGSKKASRYVFRDEKRGP